MTGERRKWQWRRRHKVGLCTCKGESAWQSVPARVSLSNTPGWMDGCRIRPSGPSRYTPVKEETGGDHTPKGDASLGLKEGRKDCVMGASACDERWICSHPPHPPPSLPVSNQHAIQSFSLSVSELSIRGGFSFRPFRRELPIFSSADSKSWYTRPTDEGSWSKRGGIGVFPVGRTSSMYLISPLSHTNGSTLTAISSTPPPLHRSFVR